jgi:hypothetical protein
LVGLEEACLDNEELMNQIKGELVKVTLGSGALSANMKNGRVSWRGAS